MATFTVNTLNNENDGIDVGKVSLTEAIEAANSTPGKDTINFQDSLTGGTIDVGGYLSVTDDVIITGLGKDNLTVNGSIYLLDNTNEASISGLTAPSFVVQGNSEVTVNLDQIKSVEPVSAIYSNLATININNSDIKGVVTEENDSLLLTINDSDVSGDIHFDNRRSENIETYINNTTINNGGISKFDNYGYGSFKLTINNSIISGSKGDGIYTPLPYSTPYTRRDETITVKNTTISNNSSNGISVGDTNLSIENSNILDNQQDGILLNDSYSLSIKNSTIANNEKNGITNNYSNLNLSNSTISGNKSYGIINSARSINTGMSFLSLGAISIVKNSTITNNQNGIYNSPDLSDEGPYRPNPSDAVTNIVNSIISGNQSDDVINGNGRSIYYEVNYTTATATFYSQGNNIVGTGNGVEDFTQPTDKINTNPKLNPLANNGGYTLTHLPKTDSPAIDAGNKQLLPKDTSDLDGDGNKTEPIPYDQRGVGFTRVFGSALDIGAVELQSQPVNVNLTVSPTSVTENGTTNLIYTFKRTGNLSSALNNVKFNVSGTATFNNDYTQSGAASFSSTTGTLNFGANQQTKTITINPTGDTVIEANETVKLSVVNGTGYKVISPTVATGTIINDDNTVSVTVSPASVKEDGSTNLVYTFKRTGNVSSALNNIKFNVSGTATFNSDYTQSGAASFSSTTGTLNFAANQASKTITINPKPDTTVEANETLKFTLVNGTDYKAISPTNATGTIANDDNTVNVTVSPASVKEDGSTNLVYTFKRTGNVSSALNNIKFNVSGTATFNNDYTQSGAASFSSTTGTLNFAANQASKTITINPKADTTVEANETLKLTLVNGTDYKAISPTNATGTIANDDVNSLLQHNSDLVALINPEVAGIF